jgi:hypothetical protein
MLEVLRNKAEELMKEDKDKYELIFKILSDDDCFKKINIETAMSILEDLGVEDKDKVYIELLKRRA